jgi:gamma-glutamyl-gamma-aminobutyraldehyde dehydrogenase
MDARSAKALSKDDWVKMAGDADSIFEGRCFINGEYVDATDGGKIEVINPATNEVCGTCAAGTEKDIDKAVAAAKESFKARTWLKMAPRKRMGIMMKFADLLQENTAELALMDSMNMGKPISDCINVDVPASAVNIRFMAECIDKMYGKIANTHDKALNLSVREPYGVVGLISPWNYPLLMGVWKLAPALAAGNSIVLKPDEHSPHSLIKVAELFVEAGGPPGVFNVVSGHGEEAGKSLALHPDVSKIGFTGSTEVGKLLLQYSGQSNMKKVSLETGGKSPMIYFADLPNMELAVSTAYDSIYANMGEVCNAGSRIYVQREIYADFVDQFIAEGQGAYTPGDPLDPETTMGPLVTAQAQKRVLGFIESGKNEGATLKFGGNIPTGLDTGCFVEPTMFADVSNDMTIGREEIFGPVASVIPFDTEEEAISMANDTIYGLCASVWTSNVTRAHNMAKAIESGMVYVNCYDVGDMTFEFGGYKQSGNSKDSCFESVLGYTQSKSIWYNLG